MLNKLEGLILLGQRGPKDGRSILTRLPLPRIIIVVPHFQYLPIRDFFGIELDEESFGVIFDLVVRRVRVCSSSIADKDPHHALHLLEA